MKPNISFLYGISISIMLLLISGCSDSLEIDTCDPNSTNSIIRAHLVNKKGENLLETETEGSIDVEKIVLYDIIGNDMVRHHKVENGWDFYGVFLVRDSTDSGKSYLFVELGEARNSKDGKYENIIQWDENRSDKIRIERKGRFIRKIWVNGRLASKNNVPNKTIDIRFVY